jgi:hypothetical protein
LSVPDEGYSRNASCENYEWVHSNKNVDIKISAQNYEWVHSNKNVGIKISAQNYEWVHSNKNVGIKISTHDAFLEEYFKVLFHRTRNNSLFPRQTARRSNNCGNLHVA